MVLRPGNAGSITAAVHLVVLDRAPSHVPQRWLLTHTPVLVRMQHLNNLRSPTFLG